MDHGGDFSAATPALLQHGHWTDGTDPVLQLRRLPDLRDARAERPVAVREKLFTLVLSTVAVEPSGRAGSRRFSSTCRRPTPRGARPLRIVARAAGKSAHHQPDLREPQKAQDASAAAFSQYIRGVETYRNPQTGESVELSNQYGRLGEQLERVHPERFAGLRSERGAQGKLDFSRARQAIGLAGGFGRRPMNFIHRRLCRSERWKQTVADHILPGPWRRRLGSNVLEVAPARHHHRLIRGRVAHLTCVEIDPPLAASLRRRVAGQNVTVLCEDATAMSLPDAGFDGRCA